MNLVPGHYGFAGPFGSITNAIRVRKFFSVSGKREGEGVAGEGERSLPEYALLV